MDDSPPPPLTLPSVDRPPPLGSWSRVYALVITMFFAEVLFFGWLTWAVS